MTQEAFKQEQDSIHTKVLQLADLHPAVKKDYRKLVQYYWYYIDGLVQYIPFDILEKMTQPESICRAFRKAVEKGEISLEENDKDERARREALYRKYYRKGKGEVT